MNENLSEWFENIMKPPVKVHYLPSELCRLFLGAPKIEVRNFCANTLGWSGDLICKETGQRYEFFLMPRKEKKELTADTLIKDGGFHGNA